MENAPLRILPHDLAAEQACLACFLVNNASLAEIRLDGQDFYDLRHQKIFIAMLKLYHRQVLIDVITLAAELTQAGQLETAGGQDYLFVLASAAATSAGVIHYEKIVSDLSQRRRFILQCQNAEAQAFKMSSDFGEIKATFKADPIFFENQVRSNPIINVVNLLNTEPPVPDQILKDLFDRGDKVAIIGSAKLRKSFFTIQSALAIASGQDFLAWSTPKPRRVLYVQFEIQKSHAHRRLKRMALALGIAPVDLGDRLHILNARGLGLCGPAGVAQIRHLAEKLAPDCIFFDPLYKIATGIENAAEDIKIILNSFDELAEQTGATILFVHHDTKGVPGSKNNVDRGSGSNVLSRDYDAAIILTAHAKQEDAIVVETILRNYKTQTPFSASWSENSFLGYCFKTAPELTADKKISRTKAQPAALATFLPVALAILGAEEMEIAAFKQVFKNRTGLGDHRIREFIALATSGEKPHVMTRELRGFRVNKKWLRVGKNGQEIERSEVSNRGSDFSIPATSMMI